MKILKILFPSHVGVYFSKNWHAHLMCTGQHHMHRQLVFTGDQGRSSLGGGAARAPAVFAMWRMSTNAVPSQEIQEPIHCYCGDLLIDFSIMQCPEAGWRTEGCSRNR